MGKMGNTPATGRKRGRSVSRKRSPPQPEQKKSRKRNNKSKNRDNDDDDGDVECVSPASSPTSNTLKKEKDPSFKWKPANGAAKLSQSVGASDAASASRRKDQKKESPLIPATSGPRCRKGDSSEMFAVEAVVKKWVGPSDRSEKDVFYLIHFAGQKKPPLKNADESLWQHPTQMADCRGLIADMERDARSQKKEAVRGPRYYYETDESESDEKPVDQRLVIESREVNGRSLRKRQENGTGTAGDNPPQSAKRQKSGRSAAVAAIGFDRNLPPESIEGSTHYQQQLLYAVKWKGVNKVDFVVSTLCHEKAPGLVIDYLVSKLQNVPSVSSDELELA